MKLKIRYENVIQTVELDAEDTQKLWVTLSIDADVNAVTSEEKEQLIQKAWNEEYNKPDYNNWHKFDRHRGYSKAKPNDETDEINTSEPLMDEVMDPTVFNKEEIEREKQWEYEAICEKIRVELKPDYAEMIIAIHLNGMRCCDYAKLHNIKPNTLNHRLQRAEKKFREVISKTSFSDSSQGYQLEDKGL